MTDGEILPVMLSAQQYDNHVIYHLLSADVGRLLAARLEFRHCVHHDICLMSHLRLSIHVNSNLRPASTAATHDNHARPPGSPTPSFCVESTTFLNLEV